ncbi:MAG: response regulator [Cyanobacteria bacterium CRU_2_1]|nr:response regulator [Cyanobacteria bacterium CRU_2_1]
MTTHHSVLVIDDEPNGFAVIEALLHREGYRLFYAASGIEALERLDAIKPDVILLDVMMPEMNGIEVCRRIKSHLEWKHIPVIIVTALNSKEDLARSLEAGADDFIAKPVNSAELRARVRSMLRIKQQYDSLQNTLQLREDMANMVVHDLRNPVATILLSSHIMMDQGELQERELERVRLIQVSAQKLNSMINDLLMMAKMESGRLVLSRTEVDLNALATVVISGFNDIVKTRNIHLKTQLPDPGHWISVDVNLVHRLIDNLVSNAIKFSPTRGIVTLQIEYLDRITNQQQELSESLFPQAIIRVSDKGSGIQEEQKQRIFEKFEIGSSVMGISQIGLGLTFCKMVVEAHGGRIWVEDNQPQGSIFIAEI